MSTNSKPMHHEWDQAAKDSDKLDIQGMRGFLKKVVVCQADVHVPVKPKHLHRRQAQNLP
jgi:hypothetical protein